jgi:hypothetical protein
MIIGMHLYLLIEQVRAHQTIKYQWNDEQVFPKSFVLTACAQYQLFP